MAAEAGGGPSERGQRKTCSSLLGRSAGGISDPGCSLAALTGAVVGAEGGGGHWLEGTLPFPARLLVAWGPSVVMGLGG